MIIYLILFSVCSGLCNSYISEDVEVQFQPMTTNLTVLEDGYDLVYRGRFSTVRRFRHYGSVTVAFYPEFRDLIEARFTFYAEEIQANKIGSCKVEDVIVNLKRGSFPAVNPDKYDFPQDFIDPALREKIHTVELQSNGKSVHYSIKNPKAGNWFAIFYVKWIDPKQQTVEQDGLSADCVTFLYTDLQVKTKEDIAIISCYNEHTVDYADVPAYFKCMSINSVDPISFNINITNTNETSELILFRVQAGLVPSNDDHLINCVFDPKLTKTQTITFSPNPSTWHYIQLDLVKNGSMYADCESYIGRSFLDDDDLISNSTVYDLMRNVEGRFFTYEFGLPAKDIEDSTSMINLTSGEIKTVRFEIKQFIDIGGNLAIDASLLMSLKYYMGYRRETKKGAPLVFTDDNQFFMVVICMSIGYASIPLKTGKCKYNDKVKPALFVLNSTDSESIYKRTVIPYPESGIWYLTLRLFCDEVVCPCRTSDNGTKYYIDPEGHALHDKEGGDILNNTREGEKNCNASVLLSISSSSCINGRCSNHGHCLLNSFGGIPLSFCQCTSGYGGWDCSDSSRLSSRLDMLISTLLLTLSNILFATTVYTATIRLYYTEAMMYTFTMLFSTFYHACDAPMQVSFCIVKGSLLQFGDFYCGIMCFWVTMLAMCFMADKTRSTLQLVGAIVIALFTTWNMHSILSFAVPMIVGLALLLLTWYLDYRKTRCFRYPKTYYTRHLPIGIVMVSVGLICYAFFQTEGNYRIVHSLWHALVALSVVFLLPDVKREGSKHSFLPRHNDFKLPFPNIFRSQPPNVRAD